MYLIALLLLVFAFLFGLILREELRYRRVAELERERIAMLEILSHQMRTPLTSIRWNTELLLRGDSGTLKIAQMELLKRMEESTDEVIDMLDRFLRFGQVEEGLMAVSPIVIDVQASIDRVLHAFEDLREAKDHRILWKHGAQSMLAFIDPIVLSSALQIVIHNALCYTPKGGTVHIKAEQSNGRITVSIQDTGIGIPLEEQPRVFKKFFRGTKARLLATSGNGLGLFLAKILLERCDGSIRFESPPNCGTTFLITVPSALETRTSP